VLEKRKQRIAGELKSAADDMKHAQAMKAEYETKLQEVHKEAEGILEDARKRAKQRETEIIAEAREEANRIVDRGNRDVELERKKALDDMKEQIISIASVMAGKVVAASIDTTVQNALIDETMKEMGESTWLS
jgi:F-type H+-transporting ATPase subunit b